MAKYSRDKGIRWERDCKNYLSDRLWPDCETARNISGGRSTGRDLIRANGQPLPYSIECKNEESFRPDAYLDQSRKDSYLDDGGQLPYVVLVKREYHSTGDSWALLPAEQWIKDGVVGGWIMTTIDQWVGWVLADGMGEIDGV